LHSGGAADATLDTRCGQADATIFSFDGMIRAHGSDVTSTDAREILRYKRGEETRIYNLRSVSDGAELWRVTELPGEPASSLRECLLKTPEEAAELLEEVRRTLIVGGWEQA
jgi:hypothetical protein